MQSHISICPKQNPAQSFFQLLYSLRFSTHLYLCIKCKQHPIKNTQLHAFGLHKLKLAICPKTCFRQTLCFRHIQSRKIQGTYFKIYALYFLLSAFFFFRLQIWRFLQWEFSCFLRSFLIFFLR